MFCLILLAVSMTFVGLGVGLITVTALNFTLAVLPVMKIVVGIVWILGGITMLYIAIRFFTLERMRKTLGRRKNFKSER